MGERDRLLAEVRSLHDVMRTNFFERLQVERSMVQQLQGELKRLAMQLAGSEAVKRHLEEQIQAAEQAKEQERAVTLEREKRAFDPTRAEAMAALKAFSALWRCACTPYAGLNGRRAEQVMREILVVSTLLQPLSELVQEPLRRALGDRAARELGGALAAEAPHDVQPLTADVADNARHVQG